MKAIIWGCGGTGKEFLDKKVLNYKYEIVCFVDSNPALWGKRMEGKYRIISPDEIGYFEFEVLIICSLYSEQILDQIKDNKTLNNKKILTIRDIEKELCEVIIEKYEIEEDEDVKASLEEYKEGKLSVLGAYNPPYGPPSEVYRDENGHPYILFYDKKMYYPDDYDFLVIDGKETVPDIMYEQGEGSPHKYIPDNYIIQKDAVILDAGVQEGNFALKYVEHASLIYLVESDPRWMDALKRTFEPYRNKVVFCNKALSGRSNTKEITIDDLVKDKLDFLKMDIEGNEVYALLGGKETLIRNNVQCAVCTYHRQNDDKYVSFILNNYGYATTHSKGYVFFSFDETIMDTMDLRRGVIYAKKGNDINDGRVTEEYGFIRV